jgi:hypothetical protein
MNILVTTTMLSIEKLLVEAHRSYDALLKRRTALGLSGIDSDYLPTDEILKAYALLGAHGRDEVLGTVHEQWPALQNKGLAYGSIEDVTTPELRLLAHIEGYTETIGPVWQQLQEAVDVSAPPSAVWRCAKRASGLWGQLVRQRFSTRGVRHLLIEPEPIFGVQPALIAVDPDRPHSGSFQFPIDNGRISITLLHQSGTVYRQEIEVMVEECT